MTTSGSKVYSLTTEQIIKDAFYKAGIYRPKASIPNENYTTALEDLNLIIKSWQSQGFNIWNDKRAYLFTQYNTASYSLGNTAHCTESYLETALTNDEVAGATEIEIDDDTGVLVGDNVGIILDDNTITWSTISGLGQITTYTEDFSSDTGFTYDNTKTEFSGGQIQQKSQRPTDATFGATYTVTINGSWANGSLSGIGTGSPVITGNRLDLSGGSLSKYVDYNAVSNANNQQTGAVKFKYTPNYSGSPVANQMICIICEANGDETNLVRIYHATSGQLKVQVYDSSNVLQVDISSSWSPTASTTYEFEFNFDGDSGASRLFIDGTQFSTTDTSTFTRSSAIGLLRIGENYTGSNFANFFLEDLVIFSSVQHTANYTAGYTLEEYDYVEDLVNLPVSTGLDITETISFITSQISNAKFNIEGVYWDGSAWVLSDNTYAQMNTATEINTNIATIPASCCITIKMRMEASNTQSKVDNLVFTYADNTISTVRISLTSGLPSVASSGNTVFIYTDKITKPLEIVDVTLQQNTSNEVLMTPLSRQEYFLLANKTSLGSPNQYYYQRRRTDTLFYIWTTPSDVSQVINLTYQPYLDNMTDQVNEPDFPIEWGMALKYALASELCVGHGVGETQFAKVTNKAQYWFDMARSNDNEDTSLTFGEKY